MCKLIMQLTFIVLLAFAIKPIYAKDIHTAHGIIAINWSNLYAVVDGADLRAILVAYGDFEKQLSHYSNTSEANDTRNDFFRYAASIENYDVIVKQGKNEYIVIFQLRLNDKINRDANTPVTYFIDANGFFIKKRS